MHYFILLNPVAGSSQPDRVRAVLAQTLAAPHSYQIYETTGDERPSQIVTQAIADGADCIVAAGGDGTVSGAVDGVAQTAVPLGILPIGTGNALARDLGIPLDLQAAARLLVSGHTRRSLDAVQIEDHFFVLRVGIGLDAAVLFTTDSAQKQTFGTWAYLLNAAKELVQVPSTQMQLTVDGRFYKFQSVRQAVLVNAATLGATALDLEWGQNVSPDDGRIEVGVITTHTLPDYLRLAWRFLTRQPQQHPKFHTLTATQTIILHSHTPMPVHGDGEPIGQTPIAATIHPHAVQLLTPIPDTKKEPGS